MKIIKHIGNLLYVLGAFGLAALAVVLGRDKKSKEKPGDAERKKIVDNMDNLSDVARYELMRALDGRISDGKHTG